jgi:hypothetical protein
MLQNGFKPRVGESFTILTTAPGDIFGTFSKVVWDSFDNGQGFSGVLRQCCGQSRCHCGSRSGTEHGLPGGTSPFACTLVGTPRRETSVFLSIIGIQVPGTSEVEAQYR